MHRTFSETSFEFELFLQKFTVKLKSVKTKII